MKRILVGDFMDRAETIMYLEGLRRTNLVTCSRQPFDEPCPKQVSLENGKQASEKKASEWISVSERLPEDGVRVLTACDDGVVRLGLSKGGFPSVVNRSHRFSDVTHWMQLPEPPK